MSAQPRDLLKPRSQRLSEVYGSVQRQEGLADGQFVAFGCVLAPGGTTSQLAISAGEYVLAQSIVNFPAVTAKVLTGLGLTDTSAGQTCYVLVEADGTQPTPALTLTQSAIVTSGTPILPALTAGRIALGYLAIPASFTFGTTALTTGICKTLPYSAGNVAPATNGF